MAPPRVHIVIMRLRTSALLAAGLMLAGCDAWTGAGGGAGMHDIHGVSGDESKPDERDMHIAEDQAQAGLRFHDDGTIVAGGTEEGEVGVVERPSFPDAGIDFLVPPVELPDEPLR